MMNSKPRPIAEIKQAAAVRRRAILDMRDQGMTIQEIADDFDVTCERVRQLLRSANRRLRDGTL